jgi:hypothetical protein
MQRYLRKLLGIEKHTWVSRLDPADCQARLEARLLPIEQCYWRAGSIVDDGSPLFFGDVRESGFTLGQYRGWGLRGSDFVRSTGTFQRVPGGTRVDLHVNGLWAGRLGIALLWGFGLLPFVLGLAASGHLSLGAIGSLLAVGIGILGLVLLLWRDDPTTIRSIVQRAVMGSVPGERSASTEDGVLAAR